MVIVVIIVAIYSMYSTWSIYQKMIQSKQKMDESQKELLALSAKGGQIDYSIGELRTQEGVEKEIRSKFGQAKSGESMAVIVSDSDASNTPPNSKSFWQKFTSFFGF